MSFCFLIDTTIHGVSVGLVKITQNADSFTLKLLWSGNHLQNDGSSAALPILIDTALKSNQITVDHIEGIVVSVGPGSFTGIKVGLGFCYGFLRGRGQKTKVLGVSSLTLACMELKNFFDLNSCFLFLPATKTSGYLAHICGSNIELKSVNTDNAEDLKKILAIENSSNLFVIGTWPALFDAIKLQGMDLKQIDTSFISSLVFKKMLEDIKTAWPNKFDTKLPQPIYLRQPLVFGKELQETLTEGQKSDTCS